MMGQETARLVSSAATTNATLVKSTTGRLHWVVGYNAAASTRYVKLYSKATAPTVGTDTPRLTLAVPPSSGFAFDLPPLWFPSGIGFALTTGSADNDTGAVSSGDILGLNLVFS